MLVVRRGRHLAITAWVAGDFASAALPRATLRSDLRGTVQETLILPQGGVVPASFYVLVEPMGQGAEELGFSRSTLMAANERDRRSLLERLDAACQRAQARGLPISLLFIDLDHVKAINDTHGHLAGDACLRAVIAPIQAELRQSDVIGRYGGEEFVLLLSSADTKAALALAST